ncbi:MAG: hypothetical protein KGI50_04375 [Patescibacteria group bacterium]|nr:hypothetical protein [Patescibacteria group bacterium]MDE2438478.1 hypothetical protein [Patescibacteria group bacterium]
MRGSEEGKISRILDAIASEKIGFSVSSPDRKEKKFVTVPFRIPGLGCWVTLTLSREGKENILAFQCPRHGESIIYGRDCSKKNTRAMIAHELDMLIVAQKIKKK